MQKYVIALYIRLSIEDYKYDSLSIENQSLALHEYAASMPEALNAEITEFIDNGYSGTNFERPQVQKLIELVRANQIDCIIVKDFSRFGRNSIETGYFIERVFPLFHTRFISISDDFDSSKFKGDTGGMDVAFKYLISEYYSRDMSIKTKSAKYAKMQRGEYQSKICPYAAKAPMAKWSLTRRPLPSCSLSSSLPQRVSTPPPSRGSCSAEASPLPASTKRRTAIIPTIFPAVTGFGVHPPFSAFWRTNATPACM